MITKDNKDVPILEITAENYLVPEREKHLYHIKLEVREFNRTSGSRISHPFIQKFNRIDVENGLISILRQQGYTVEILHDPKAWLAGKAASEAKSKEEAEAARKAEEREAIRKELLKEMAEEKKKSSRSNNKSKDKGVSAEAPAESPSETSSEGSSETPAESTGDEDGSSLM